jgi:hypothetical protein
MTSPAKQHGRRLQLVRFVCGCAALSVELVRAGQPAVRGFGDLLPTTDAHQKKQMLQPFR